MNEKDYEKWIYVYNVPYDRWNAQEYVYDIWIWTRYGLLDFLDAKWNERKMIKCICFYDNDSAYEKVGFIWKRFQC